MSKIEFPNTEDILWWGKQLLESEFPEEYLPIITRKWARSIADCVEVTSLLPSNNDVIESAGRIFYKVIKNHRLVDGNKRSSLVVTYFFLALNGFRLKISPNVLYELARTVAKEKEFHEDTVGRLKTVFINTVENID